MRGTQVMLLALFLTMYLTGCRAAATSSNALQHAKQTDAHKLSLQDIIESLGAREATLASVAASVGTLGERDSSEYVLHPRDSNLGDVRMGTNLAGMSQTAPTYLKLYLPSTTHYRLSEVQPGCVHWTGIPGNPAASPFQYGCHLPVAANGVPVNLIARLSGAASQPDSLIEAILLQRGGM